MGRLRRRNNRCAGLTLSLVCALINCSLKTWGCIGIRQDDLEPNGRNQGIVLSPLISVSAN